MKMTEHLNMIEQLLLEQASQAKIRPHILVLREQLEAGEKTAARLRNYKRELAQLRAENAALKQEKMKSRFRKSDPAAHILRALALLGEGNFSAEQVAIKAAEPIVKVRHLLNNLCLLGYVVRSKARGQKKRYSINREHLDELIQHGIM